MYPWPTLPIMASFAPAPMLGSVGDVVILVLPVIGSMLLFYGIYQVVVESKASSRKKMQDRLRGKRTKIEKARR